MPSKARYIKRYQDFSLKNAANVYYTCYVVGTIQSMLNVLIHLILPKWLSIIIIPISQI